MSGSIAPRPFAVRPLVPQPGWSVAVVVPARDEADRIAACVRSVQDSLVAAGCTRTHLVVVTDGCTDGTVDVARAVAGPSTEVVSTHAGNVGAARRLGTARAIRQLARSAASAGERLDPARTWLLTTDADSVVPLGWVDAHLRLADVGAAGVAGIVRLLPPEGGSLPDGLRAAFEAGYALHPDGSHPHVHGANLGIRADAYGAVGGWRPLTTAEDHDLWDRVRAAGWPTVSAIDPWVATSSRLAGRAPTGFADDLAAIAAGPSATVEPAPEPAS